MEEVSSWIVSLDFLRDHRADMYSVFDDEMKTVMSTISKAPQFKWERDFAAHRSGKDWTPPAQSKNRDDFDPFFIDDMPAQGIDEGGFQPNVSCSQLEALKYQLNNAF